MQTTVTLDTESRGNGYNIAIVCSSTGSNILPEAARNVVNGLLSVGTDENRSLKRLCKERFRALMYIFARGGVRFFGVAYILSVADTCYLVMDFIEGDCDSPCLCLCGLERIRAQAVTTGFLN